jgi:hypothetical protein
MPYNPADIEMLRTVLDELLVSDAFARQSRYSAIDVAQHVLRLAAQGERDAAFIRACVEERLSMRAA